jgi:hypothetical protein
MPYTGLTANGLARHTGSAFSGVSPPQVSADCTLNGRALDWLEIL